MNYYRHGDLSFHFLQEAPKNLKKVECDGSFVLAYGEVTGHRHLLKEREADSFDIFQNENGQYVLNIKKPTQLFHEEHQTIIIQPGWYIQENEREFDWFQEGVRKVID